ncbi:MAG: hypothetical protein WCT19_02455 [Candidatus Paceibacterota bacterium]|jgi:hypothetical protein
MTANKLKTLLKRTGFEIAETVKPEENSFSATEAEKLRLVEEKRKKRTPRKELPPYRPERMKEWKNPGISPRF